MLSGTYSLSVSRRPSQNPAEHCQQPQQLFRFLSRRLRPPPEWSLPSNIFANNKKIGLIGKVHPVIAESFEISDDSFLLEISVDDLCELATEQVDFQEVPKFPSSERDLSLIISNDITSEQIINEINSLKIDILKSIKIFDVYRDDKIAANCYSISINFFFNKVVSTLTDKEVDEQIAKILKCLQDKFNAQLR